LIFGIILGVLIVFNWTSIRSYFDSSLSREQKSVEAPSKEQAPAKVAEKPNEAQKTMDLNNSVEQRLKDIAAGKGN
jgi:hypothetical protein